MADEDFKEEKSSRRKTNFKPRGASGTLVTGFQIQDDYISSLNGVQAQETFHKMLLSDSQIRKVVHAVSNPIRSAIWDIEPASDSKKDLEVAALIKQIIFKDIPDGFEDKLDEILTFPWQGHSVFEIIHKNRTDKVFGDYTGLANLAYRDQRTLDEWHFSREGILEKIHQTQSGEIEVNEDMPADTLLIFYNEKKGNDSGYPFCRMLFGNYKRKLLEKELQVIGIEKGAIGIPILTLPPGIDYNSTEYNDAVEKLEEYTQAESSHIILPDGYKLELNQNNTYDPAKTQVAIKAENEEIVGALVAMWLEMGIGGNSAVGSSTGISAEFFRDGIIYIANKVRNKFNLQLITNLVALNFGDTVDVMPTLEHSGIADDAGKELMEIVTGYTKSGIITPDEPLEDHVRKVHNLPKKADGEMLDNQETQDGSEDDPDPNLDDPAAGNEPAIPVELASKDKPKTPRALISVQGEKASEDIKKTLEFSSAKYVNDTIVRYRQLSKNRKQNATNKIKIAGANSLKKDLKRTLTDTVNLSIDMVRLEIPSKKDVELSSKDKDLKRIEKKYGSSAEIKLNDFSKLPSHIQVLIAKQADLISADSLEDLKKRLDFSFSSIQTKSSDENVIKQAMEEEANKFIESNQVSIKGNNVAALMVNEGRDTFFFEPDVLEEIHSFTFVNSAPVALICKELAGTVFNTNDAESLRYSPPLHHNCKSYLRANLKVSRGVEQLEVSTLSPSAEAKKTVTL